MLSNVSTNEPGTKFSYSPLQIGPIKVGMPVVLAPMAGVTNSPFRRICRSYGAGLYVSEMISARALCEQNERTFKLAAFAPDEIPRSLQLAVVDPEVAYKAVRILVEGDLVDHIDINFGCPVRKVTRNGGGGALPYKRQLFEAILNSAVKAAEFIPVTIKMRIGIDETHTTYLESGRIAEDSGIAAVGLHGRTVEQLYSAEANWETIAKLKQAVTSIPVLGNGDIWQAEDAIAMMNQTGCDGVIIGRGCLGRPWLFGQLSAAFNSKPIPKPPTTNEVKTIMLEHAKALTEWFGDHKGIREFRKHTAWYLKGYPVGGAIKKQLGMAESIPELENLLLTIKDHELPEENIRSKRGHTGGPQKVVLPQDWLKDPLDSAIASPEGDSAASGG